MFTHDSEGKANYALKVHLRRTHKEQEGKFKATCPHCSNVQTSDLGANKAKHSLRHHIKIKHPEHFQYLRPPPKVATPAPPSPPAEQVIQTITVEVPVVEPLDKTLHKLSTPILLGELFTRLLTRLDRLEHALLASHHQHNNDALKPPAPRPSIADIPSPTLKRSPRIAIGGLMRDQFEHVKAKLTTQDVELIWVDTDSRQSTKWPRADAAVISRHVRHAWWDAAQAELGHSRVFFAEGISTVTQKCYDFLSRESANLSRA